MILDPRGACPPMLSALALLIVAGAGHPSALSGQAAADVESAGRRVSGEIRMRRLGNAGWEITDGEVTLLVDPYLTLYSSETGGRGEDGTRVPDDSEIERRIPAADYVLVTHAHPDHALDATAVARIRGASLIGRPSVMNIARAYGVAGEQLITVLGGEDYEFGTFSVRVLPSLHTALFDKRYHDSRWAGEVPAGLDGPLTSDQFREGGTLAYLIRIGGHAILALGSMNYIEREMEGLRPTVALVGALEARNEIYRYTPRLMRALGCPPVVFPTHVDLRRDSAREAVRELGDEVRRACPSTRYLVPVRLRPITVRAGGGDAPVEVEGEFRD